MTLSAQSGLKVGCALIAAVIGIFESWRNRHAITADGVSYLDVADAYFRGDWHSAITGYWSPLYSWIVGLVLFGIQPDMRWEYPVAHFVSLMIYLGTILAFNYFLNDLLQYHRAIVPENNIPDWYFILTGYSLFLWATSALITWDLLTPDMLVALIVFLTGSLLIRMRLKGRSVKIYAFLGFVLGFGYLAKTVMFIGAFLFLVASITSLDRLIAIRVITALVCFLLLAAPLVGAISYTKGRFTVGDTGKLNYAWFVNKIKLRHWQGEEKSEGSPIHPTQKIFDSPPIYQFDEPFNKATYPVWYDASYWYDGLMTSFESKKQARAVLRHLYYFSQMFSFYGALIVAGMIVVLSNHIRRERLVVGCWWLLVPSLSLMAVYSLVHVEPRLVSPFLVIILLVMISSLSLSGSLRRRRLILAGIFLILVSSIGPDTYRAWARAEPDQMRFLETAEEVRKLGVLPGDKIGSLGYSNLFISKWARLAKIRIVAEIYSQQEVELYWAADGQTKQKVIDAFRRSGCVLIVSDGLPPGRPIVDAEQAGWRSLGKTGVFIYPLSALPNNPPGQEK